MNYRWSTCELTGLMLPGNEEREIPENPLGRGRLPGNVFCYPLVNSWRKTIWSLLGDVITDDVRLAFTEAPPEFVVSDDLSWLDELIFEVTGELGNIKELTAHRLRQKYHFFRAAHGTRTNDLAQFYNNGLRFLRSDEMEDRARSLFLNGKLRFANEERLQLAIRENDARKTTGGREGRLYFCADERNLLTRSGSSGHYLVYGSEYLYCLGIRLGSSWEAKRILKEIGRPTMFICDIPMSQIRDYTLQEFAGLVLEFLFCELVKDLQAYALSPGAGSGFSLPSDLSPDYIVGHYHPDTVHDPLWSA
ncbi:hypothetical protein [Rhizobium hainanense]|uniref:Uncharacterized protein n=1 Tax=Rhizobium hainanense TaxID=52131 RepID=A0A1C3W9W0_9HYPH|nr:hypothetical protein [Rhizobium hainanense]SCB36676.1 hypothetical protein GA0061100_113125 [Rhizobium hainanense]